MNVNVNVAYIFYKILNENRYKLIYRLYIDIQYDRRR